MPSCTTPLKTVVFSKVFSGQFCPQWEKFISLHSFIIPEAWFSWYNCASLSAVTSSPCAVRLCMARVDVCLYVLPQWLHTYDLEWVWTTWCLYRLEYSVNLFPHPATVHIYGFSPTKQSMQLSYRIFRKPLPTTRYCTHIRLLTYK